MSYSDKSKGIWCSVSLNTVILRLQIDFVAHDDIPYTSAGSHDVYKHIKEAGEDMNRYSEFFLCNFSH